jgi:hypothetical protein
MKNSKSNKSLSGAGAAMLLSTMASLGSGHTGTTITWDRVVGPGSRASRLGSGRSIAGGAEYDEPFQDSNGKWYVKTKKGIRKVPKEK